MLIEKYMNVAVEMPPEDEYTAGEMDYEEVYVKDSDIKHYIDTFLSAEDVLNYAKQIDPSLFDGKKAADLDTAYDLIIDEFDEHDDIEDFRALNEWIQECVQNDYEAEAAESMYDKLDSAADEETENSHYIRNNMPR
jgi:hypothetical protein